MNALHNEMEPYAKVDKDLELYSKLLDGDPVHWSPSEHPCKPCDGNVQRDSLFVSSLDGSHYTTFNTQHLPRVGNFPGFVQHRLQLEAERGAITFV